MFQSYNTMNFCFIGIVILFHLNSQSISALSCYECTSTFPSNSICLPACYQSDRANSTCLLTRNIPLEAGSSGSLSASHISAQPFFLNAEEPNFVYGEEAVYQNPSAAIGWDWEYGPVTYGCDTSGCNTPEKVNRLPDALNARIPNATLNQLTTGDFLSRCHVCDLCLTDDVTGADISDCGSTSCAQGSCNFVATRSSTTGPSQCDGGWHFMSGCVLSKEPAQVDMTLMYYIRSKTHVLYQMDAICLGNTCNDFTLFKRLKDAITVDPDLYCLVNDTSFSTTTGSTTRTTTTTTGTGTGTTSTTRTSTGTGTGSTTRTTTRATTTTTTTGKPSSAGQIFINTNIFILTIISFYIIKF